MPDDLNQILNLGTNVAIVVLFLRYMKGRDIQIAQLVKRGNKVAALLSQNLAELTAIISNKDPNDENKNSNET